MTGHRQKAIYKTTVIGSIVNVLLTIGKFWAGVAGHSSAMLADAVHSLSDLISDVIVLVFVHIAGRPADADHNFGHDKYETLATVLVGAMLLLVGVTMAVDGIKLSVGFIQGKPLPLPNWLALGAAIVSLASKDWLYRYTVRVGRKINSAVLVANAWHHRSDALTSLAALIGIGGAMWLGPRGRILDPLAAVFVSIYIIVAAWKLIRPSLDELLEKSLPEAQVNEIRKILMQVGGVEYIHRLRTRRIGTRSAISVHIKMDGSMSLYEAHRIASEAEQKLRDRYGPSTIVSIHMEPLKIPVAYRDNTSK